MSDQKLKGWIKSRPLRVAFLVEESEHHQLMLDGIIADCYARWGGRFSLIAPCLGQKPRDDYWPWLEAFDPDVVYSYVQLERAAVLEIHERLSPSYYRQHDMGPSPRLDVHGFRPKYDFQPLSSLSLVFRLARYSADKAGEPPVKIIERHFIEEPTRFFADNFGSYIRSTGTGIFPSDASSAAMLLPVVSPELAAQRNGISPDLKCLSTELEALQEYAAKRATSLSQLSLRFASKLNVRRGNWSGTFNLVVGETFADRVMFWNARLLLPQWLDNDVCCLRVTLDQLREPSILASVGDILKHRNHVNGGSGGQSQTVIRSTSLTGADLEEALALIQSTKPWGYVGTERVTRDVYVPDAEALKSAREGNSHGQAFGAPPEWHEFQWSGDIANPPPSQPDHLADAPHRQNFVAGIWAADVRLEHAGAGPRLMGGGTWVLPKRWRMAHAFAVEFHHTPAHTIPPDLRRGRDGVLTVFCGQDRQPSSVKVPSDFTAIRQALVLDGAWAKADAPPALAVPSKRVGWMRLSNEARYFDGVVGMAGRLRYASQLLLHPFLEATFAKLGGAPGLPEDKLKPMLQFLEKQSKRQPTIDLTDERERRAVASRSVKAADGLKRARSFISYTELARGWSTHRTAFWAARSKPEPEPVDDGVDWDGHEAATLDECLIELRNREMLFQGHHWPCPNCHHHNWVDMSALTPTLTCNVCKQPQPAPVSFDWQFRPNEFLIEALRAHSVLSVLWTVSELCSRARQSVILAGSSQFGQRDEGRPTAEADVLAVVDGECIACEVKNSWGYVNRDDLAKLVTSARVLRPDKVMLAVMDDSQTPHPDLPAIKQQVEGEGVAFELLTGRDSDSFDSPYLGLTDPA